MSGRQYLARKSDVSSKVVPSRHVQRETRCPAASPSSMQPALRLKPQAQANYDLVASSQNGACKI